MTTSLRSVTPYPSGGTPPIHIPFFFEAAILSRMRSPMTSRSNCAKDNSTLRVKRPIEVVVLNCDAAERNRPLRDLHPQIVRGGARTGIQFAAGAARSLRGLHRQPAARRLVVPAHGL